MNRMKPVLLKAQLDALRLLQAHRLLAARTAGLGAIFTLHHVRPAGEVEAFAPNRILDITPGFLARVIPFVRELGYRIVSLDELRTRLLEGDESARLVAFTLDDGYRDNLTHAAPVFERFDAPFTVYLTTSMPNGRAVLWWEHLERIVREHDGIRVRIGDQTLGADCRTTGEKYVAFETIYWRLRAAPLAVQLEAVEAMLADYGLEPFAACRASSLSWDDLAVLAKRPGADIGVHTVNHHALSKLDAESVGEEALASRSEIQRRLDVEPRHFCYPFGDAGSASRREFDLVRELGFATATTTRKGVLFREHRDHLHALPRVSLNGDYQKLRYVEMFLSGAPFALLNRFRRLDVA